MKTASTILVLVLASAIGCSNGLEDKARGGHDVVKVNRAFKGEYPISIVCTTGMVADLARNVGGDYVRIVQLMGADVDPHLFKASAGDIRKLGDADLIFYSGLHLEGKMASLLESMGRKRPIFAVTEYLEAKEVLSDPERKHDPHLWFDVGLWSQGVKVVSDVLSAFDSKHADEYKSRGAVYRADLLKLHTAVKEKIAVIPRERRVLVTAHDAFRYFGRAYDIEVKGIQGISTESEAGVKDINDLVEFISNRGIKAVFVETSVNERNMQAVLEGCRARGHSVRLGGTLFSDAMGPEGTPEGTYIGMVRHNVDTIVGALQ